MVQLDLISINSMFGSDFSQWNNADKSHLPMHFYWKLLLGFFFSTSVCVLQNLIQTHTKSLFFLLYNKNKTKHASFLEKNLFRLKPTFFIVLLLLLSVFLLYTFVIWYYINFFSIFIDILNNSYFTSNNLNNHHM